MRSGGTLFLDEIEIDAAGAAGQAAAGARDARGRAARHQRARPLDIRVVAATKVDLATPRGAAIFARTSISGSTSSSLRIPPLRERREDIPLLFGHFLSRAAERFGRPAPQIDDAASATPASARMAGQCARARPISPSARALGLAPGARGRPASSGRLPVARLAAGAGRRLRGRASSAMRSRHQAATCARRSRRSACRARPSTTSSSDTASRRRSSVRASPRTERTVSRQAIRCRTNENGPREAGRFHIWLRGQDLNL